MDALIELTNVNHDWIWGLIAAVFPLFTGFSAGSLVISALANVFGQDRYKPISKFAAKLALVFLFMAILCLFLDAGQPLRFLNAMTSFAWTSAFAIVGYLIAIYGILGLVYLWSMGDNRTKLKDSLKKYVAILLIPIAFAVHADTGFVFGIYKGTSLWFTPLQPILFIASAVLSGAAMLLILAVIRDRYFAGKGKKYLTKDVVHHLAVLIGWLIAIDIGLWLVNIIAMSFGTVTETGVLDLLLIGGPYAIPFIGVEFILGMIVPIAILMTSWGRKHVGILVASACVVVGTFAMRSIIVLGGWMIPRGGTGLREYVTPPGMIDWTEILEILAIAGVVVAGVIAFWVLTVIFDRNALNSIFGKKKASSKKRRSRQ